MDEGIHTIKDRNLAQLLNLSTVVKSRQRPSLATQSSADCGLTGKDASSNIVPSSSHWFSTRKAEAKKDRLSESISRARSLLKSKPSYAQTIISPLSSSRHNSFNFSPHRQSLSSIPLAPPLDDSPKIK